MKTTKTPRASLCCKRTARQILTIAFALLIAFTTGSIRAGAVDIQSTVFYTGTMKLLNDLLLWATVAAPVIGGLAAIIFGIRCGMADDQDGKIWKKRAIKAGISGVVAALVTGIIAVITSYYTA